MGALAYDAPFPDARYKAGVRRFPQLVPVQPGMADNQTCLRGPDEKAKLRKTG